MSLNRFLLGFALLLALGGCSSDPPVVGTTAGSGGEGGANAPDSPAVMLVGQVFTTDNYNTYVGVLPDVPEGDVSFAKFREFGNANAYTHGGYVFVEEDGRMKRFAVSEELELIDGPEFSWLDFGVASINASYTVFVSVERAYTFAPELGVVIVWNPETMEYTGTLPAQFPQRPADMETWAYDGHLVGDQVIWNVFSGNFETLEVYPAVTLAIADAHSDVPLRFVEDERCLPGGPAFLDERGDYWVHGGGYYGYFWAYAARESRTCLLRVPAGASEPDRDFSLYYEQLTGTPVNEAWIHVAGSKYFTRAWDPELEFPADPEAFWGNPALRPILVDTEEHSAVPYPDLQDTTGIDGTTRELDGVSYYQVSDTGYVEGGNTEVVELRADGTRPKFHLDGFLLGLERVR